MRKTLKDFYYGNIAPSEEDLAASSNLRRAMIHAVQCESRLTEKLSGTEQAILEELVRTRCEIDGIMALENFILGFRLGVRIMAECMDDNDGGIRNGG